MSKQMFLKKPESEKIIVRKAVSADAGKIGYLYRNTIKSVNKKDYNRRQIEIWVSGFNNFDKWKVKITEQNFYVAELNDEITGFASVTDEGYIDFMFTHKDYQGQGIATKLLNVIEKKAAELKLKKLWAVVSITARPFFKSKGFEISRTYTKKIEDVVFHDAEMTKVL